MHVRKRSSEEVVTESSSTPDVRLPTHSRDPMSSACTNISHIPPCIRSPQGLRLGDIILCVNGRQVDRKLAVDLLDASQSYADVVYLPGKGELPSLSRRGLPWRTL